MKRVTIEPRPRRFVPAATVVAAFRGAPKLDPSRFRADIDRVLDQDPAPRDSDSRPGTSRRR